MPQLHPDNHSFSWRPSQKPYALLTEEQAASYDEKGYFLFENAFQSEELDRVANAIAPFEAELEAHLRTLEGGRFRIAKADAITFTIHLVGKSETLKAFSRHPVLQGICHDTLGPKARLYWDQAVYKKPGNPEEFPWHQDNGYTFVEPQQYLTCWIPLTDATVENGCPWVVPGLHRQGTFKHEATPLGWQCLENPSEAVPIPAKKGDIVVFSSLTPHRTGPNLTKGVRKAYILQYAPDGAFARMPDSQELTLQNDPVRQYLISEDA